MFQRARTIRITTILVLAIGGLVAQASTAAAGEPPPVKSGEITIPWSEFKTLLDRLDQLSAAESKAAKPPSDFLLSAAYYKGAVSGKSLSCEGRIDLEVLTDGYVKIPVFPTSLPVEKATLDGQPVTLTPENDWVHLVIQGKAKHKLVFNFAIPVRGIDEENVGFGTARTAVTLVELNLPWADREVHVLPHSGLTATTNQKETHIKAVLPVTDHVFVSWASATKRAYNIAYADYSARVNGDAVEAEAKLKATVSGQGRVRIPLVGTTVALESVEVDGKPASPYIDGTQFAIDIDETGEHEIVLRFVTKVDRNGGPPHVSFDMPPVPVSTLAFEVPGGNHTIEVTPSQRSDVTYEENTTILKTLLPVTNKVDVSWIAGGRPDKEEELFAYADVSSLCQFVEGVFRCTHDVKYDIRRGKMAAFTFRLPEGWEVFDVSGEDIHSWSESNDGGERKINVLLKYPKDKSATAKIVVEKLVPSIPAKFEMPWLAVDGVERSRGVVVVQLTDEYEIAVSPDENIVRVDASQIPPTLRSSLGSGAAAEVYKYTRSPFQATVSIDRPPVVTARLTADFNLLATIGEESIACDASVRYEVVRGEIETLQIQLPPEIRVNSVNVPDLKDYKTEKTTDSQTLAIVLQRKTKGVVPVTMVYEILNEEAKTEALLPVPTFPGVERVRHTYGIAAPSNIEVVPIDPSAKGMISVNQLPPELKGRASQPVLLAYQFARSPEPVRLNVLKHSYIAVQDSVIDSMNATTIYTRDGTAVTMASLSVHNTQRQFLKVAMETDCKIWNVFIEGQVVTPAKDSEGRILIPLRKSNPGSANLAAFAVDLIYMRPAKSMKTSGRLGVDLPKFDIAINELVWSVYLPEDYRYYKQTGTIRPMTTQYQEINLKQEESYAVSNLYEFSGERNADEQVRKDVQKELRDAKEAGPALNEPKVYMNRALQRQAQVENDLLNISQQRIPQRFQKQTEPTAGGTTPVRPVSTNTPDQGRPILPLRVNIPTEGKIYRFSKLYATENSDGAHIEISYSRPQRLVIIGIVLTLIALGILAAGGVSLRRYWSSRRAKTNA